MRSSIRALAAVVLAALGVPSIAAAAFIPLYGSPTPTPDGDRFLGIDRTFDSPGSGGLNAAGTAVGSVTRFDIQGHEEGDRGIRWDASGTAVELGNLRT